MGGTCTLIGTSTNLVVHGLLLEAGYEGFSFFEITRIGVPVALLSILFITLVGRYLLPDRKDVITELGESTREFVVELKVGEEYPHLNQTIEQANLRHLPGLFLFQISRDDHTIAPVSPREKIQQGDRLFFTGLTDTIFELQKTPGLHSVKDQQFNIRDIDSDKFKTFEVVVSNTSHLVGDTVRDSGFRSHYNAV
ncbi:SLC13 family permease, partial [bacterium]|nr:SLC13 family permease [bacterium]